MVEGERNRAGDREGQTDFMDLAVVLCVCLTSYKQNVTLGNTI